MSPDPHPAAPALVPTASLAEASQIRFLDPARVRFFQHGATLRLTLADECSVLKASVLRAFPLSSPEGHLSVRDGGGKEVGILPGLAGLDPDSRLLVEREVERRYLLFRVRRIVKVVERFGTVDWDVETDRGRTTFTTRDLRENLLRPDLGRYILADVENNRYEVEEIAKLDAASQSWLLRFV
jgi:hypothetical protein